MKRRDKITAVLLTAAMSAGVLSGCGGSAAKTAETTAKAAEAAKTEAAGTADTTAAPADEEPVEITLMANFGELGEKGKIWVTQLEEACNVKINWKLPAVSSYEDTLQLMMIDDEKPDAVLLPDAWLTSAVFSEGCEDGVFMNLADMVPAYENIVAHTADISWQALDVLQNDGIWGIPRSTMARSDGFMAKTEWLEAIGSDYKEGDYMTADELFDILYKFTYEDPDGNGVNDTYGLKAWTDANGALITKLNYIFGIGDTDSWCEYDGEYMALKYSKTRNNFKEYLAFVNKCWEAGVMDPDAFSIDAEVSTDRWKSGMYGLRSQFAGWKTIIPLEGQPWTETYIPGIVPNEGDSYGYPSFSTGIWYFWAIPSTCERPDKVLELFDYILSDEQWVNLGARGIKDVTFQIKEDGTYDFTLSEGLETADKAPLDLMVRRSDGADFFIDKKYPLDVQAELKEYIDLAVENYVPALDRGYAPAITTDPVFIEYNNYMTDEINKIIIGEKPVDHWDEVLDGWYKAGGEEYVADMQAYIASMEK